MLKKSVLFLSAFFVCISLFSGCTKKYDYTAEEICDFMVPSVFSDYTSTVLSGDQIQNYFSFDTSIMSDYKVVLCTETEKYNIIAVFRPKNQENVQEILEGVNSAVTSSAVIFKSLNENEYKKITNRLLYEKDGLYILIISDDYEAAKNQLKEINAKELK